MNILNYIDINTILEIAKEACEKILEIYHQEFKVELKDDNSPLTLADRASDKIITNALKKLNIELNNFGFSNIGIISEEQQELDFSLRSSFQYIWMIDPLDGTKEFVKKNGNFSVNIALLHKNRPILGVVALPVSGDVYYALKGHGAYKNGKKLPLDREKDSTLRVVASSSHLNEKTAKLLKNLRKNFSNLEVLSLGSSIKFCLVAEGRADIYPRISKTMEWDSAAAHIIVNESGGVVLNLDEPHLGELTYNKTNLENPNFVVVLDKKILKLLDIGSSFERE